MDESEIPNAVFKCNTCSVFYSLQCWWLYDVSYIHNILYLHFICTVFPTKIFCICICICTVFPTTHSICGLLQSAVGCWLGDVSSIDDAHVSLCWINDPVMASSITPRIIAHRCQHHHCHPRPNHCHYHCHNHCHHCHPCHNHCHHCH